MQVQVSGHHLDVGDALRTHATERLEAAVAKYFDRPVDGQVTFTKQGHEFRADCSVHLSSGLRVNAQGTANEVYASFDAALERGERIDTVLVRQVVEFMREFADRCHHAKEERILFPEMVRKGVPEAGCPIGGLL